MKTQFLTRCLLPVLLVPYTAIAAASLVVTGPDFSMPGDLVVLTAKTDTQTVVCAWTVIPPETVDGKYLVCDGGRSLVFASRLPGTYYFNAATVIDGKPVTSIHRLDNVLPDATPQPPPEPPLPPPPVVNVDAEIAALQQLAATKAVELVKSQFFDREKKALSESFFATAKWLEQNNACSASGACEAATPEQVRTKQRENSRRYLSSVNREAWQTWNAWNNEIGKKLAEIDAAKNLTSAQIGEAYKQIGKGLQ